MNKYFVKLHGKSLYLAITSMLLLIAIPFSILVAQRQQNDQSKATQSTIVSFNPTSSDASPIMKAKGESIPLDIMINPGQNAVSLLTVVIQYDPSKLSLDQLTGFSPNSAAFPTILEGPVFADGQVAVSLSIGSDPTKAITQPVKAGTVTFTSIDGTGSSVTHVMFTTTTSAQSVGAADSAGENVVSSTVPATIAIAGDSTNPTATQTPNPTTGTEVTPTTGAVTPSITSIPTGVGGVPLTVTPNLSVTLTASPTGQAVNPVMKQSLISLFRTRGMQFDNIMKKIDRDVRISKGHKGQMKKNSVSAQNLFATLTQLLNQASTQQNLQQNVGTGLQGILNNYIQEAKQLDTFAQALQAILLDLQKQGADITRMQTQLDQMKAHIVNIEQIASAQSTSLGQTSATTGVAQMTVLVRRDLDRMRLEFRMVSKNIKLIIIELQQALRKNPQIQISTQPASPSGSLTATPGATGTIVPTDVLPSSSPVPTQ